MTVRRLPDDSQRWIVARQRPDENAPSYSGSFRGGSTNIALIRYLERYPDHAVGSRVTVRKPGTGWREFEAAYVRTEHLWECQR